MFYCDIPEYSNISFLFNYLNFWGDAFIAIVIFTDFFILLDLSLSEFWCLVMPSVALTACKLTVC